MARTILSNARIVLEDEVIAGTLVMHEGRIEAIDTGHATVAGAEDCDGDLLIPGLIELHTDNLERHMQPRPKVTWPHAAAILAHDAELAACGITTVFDAMRVGSVVTDAKSKYGKYARALAGELLEARRRDMLKISHFLHLRAETCSETLLEELAEFGAEDRVGILSLMDHTPGQRQFRDIEKYRDYMCGKHGLSAEDFDAHVDNLTRLRGTLGAAHEAGAVAAARRLGAVLASHDDTTAEHVAVSKGHGARLAEFPTTVEAARACKQMGIAVMMGAPNLIRGGSHSGNVAAEELARHDLLDIVSSDYVPAALMGAAFLLADLWDDLPRGLATVSAAPAAAAGLVDRGRLAPGLLADVVRLRRIEGQPCLRGVWSHGRRVA
ncbi:alpha-D-ribose 1-methylphosphonate 5-triphosphate diphosphatase [Salipiger mangrovisoli]|uniref:Alpha-D-ribose 1-methylphosphonate 5-triphosphate diphosphatase n=1 Tax=Salipiger mangrovisoli TaxID=2865933 RepID=A0ABR9WVK0_9RHOB|nr:alpha-D-ribose 1-methylphosphonate 5-triphosphate diphosphatase [Salipiger mangrovisoli]MBE9635315.1 alpha-D-ribose 1-methylphosphonate 5-triphosphate diphosphatase [Salipiger mangrovisoli]